MASPGRYAAAYANPNGAGDARPTALQIVRDEDLEGRLSDKVFLVTGCSSGMGPETARALSATGATVFCTARDLKKAEQALAGILDSNRVHLLHLDLESLDSVRACAKEFLKKSEKLNGLIANAGVMFTPEGRTKDGFETHIGTNHLSHFLLFNLLKPALLAGSTPEFNSRVVMVSSIGHRSSEIHFDNINLEGEYKPPVGYGQSKTANIYMANEIERRFGAQGLHGLSLNPGGFASGLQKHMDPKLIASFDTPEVRKCMSSLEQAAATSVIAAIGKEFEGKGALYLANCGIGSPVKKRDVFDPGYSEWAFDQEQAARLWDLSLKMVNIESNE